MCVFFFKCLWLCLAKRVMFSSHDSQLSCSQHWHCRRSEPWGWSNKGISVNHKFCSSQIKLFSSVYSLVSDPACVRLCVCVCSFVCTYTWECVGAGGWSHCTSVNLSTTGTPHAKSPLSIKTTFKSLARGCLFGGSYVSICGHMASKLCNVWHIQLKLS